VLMPSTFHVYKKAAFSANDLGMNQGLLG
jgi:hypothetical protein